MKKYFPINDIIKNSIVTFFISYFLFLAFIIYATNFLNLIKIISNLLIIFGISFSAFIIIGIFIIFSMDRKEWFDVFKKTKTFKTIIITFKSSFVFNILCVFIGITSELIIYFNLFLSNILIKFIIYTDIFYLIFSILWTILCIKILRNIVLS